MDGFSARLKEARGSATQVAVAQALGIKQQAYARYESGGALPGAEILQRICLRLGVSADWLLGLTDKRGAAVSATNSTVAAFGSSVTGGDCSRCPLMLAAKEALAPANGHQAKKRG